MHQTLEPGWRRIAFYAWAAILVAVLGVAFFGLTSLVLAWFQEVEGVAGPVTDLGYGVLLGIILTTGLLVQLRSPERKIAGVQQAFLVIPALVIGSAIASDSQNLVPALILLPAIGILLALHPAREEFFRRGVVPSRILLAITGRRCRPTRFLRTGHGSAGARPGGSSTPRAALVDDGRHGPCHRADRPARRASDARMEDPSVERWHGCDRVRLRVGGLPGSTGRRGAWMGRRGYRGRCPVYGGGRMGGKEGDGRAWAELEGLI